MVPLKSIHFPLRKKGEENSVEGGGGGGAESKMEGRDRMGWGGMQTC